MKPLTFCLLIAASFPAAPIAAQSLRVVGLDGPPARRGGIDARIGEAVRLGVRRALPAGTEVTWLRVLPRLKHTDTPPPNEGDPTFSNAVLTGPNHGRWLGYDTLEYDTIELQEGEHVSIDAHEVVLRAMPAATRRGRVPTPSVEGVGTMWIGVRATLPDGRVLSTIDGVDRLGLRRGARAPMRVSFRSGDDFAGWLSAFFDVPFVFGSTPAQVERFLGVDCADVMVAARRRETGRDLAYTSVNGISELARETSDVLLIGADGVVRREDGTEARLRWGHDLEVGDLVAIDYASAGDALPRPWDHIGALLEDRGPEGRPDGILGGDDLVRHMGNRGLTDEALREHGRIRARIWRWRR